MIREASREQHVVGRYMLCDEIAAGGMATVHIGRLLGPVGFARTVAIKRLHAHFAKDPEFVAMFLDEARIAARVRHPNVVATLDVVVLKGEMLVVMEYVHGEPLSRLVRASRETTGRGVPPAIALSVIAGALYGLHAAHEAKDDQGGPLEIVHRDVSPQNVIVGQDGIPRVVDFGVAKATGRMQATRDGALKGKLAYMSPEQIASDHVDRRTDVYAASVVLWEMLTGQRLFSADNQVHILNAVLHSPISPPSRIAPELPPALDALVMKGLSRDPAQRFATAADMAEAAQQLGFATSGQIGTWVKSLGGAALDQRAARVVEIESTSSSALRASMIDDGEATIVREIPEAPPAAPAFAAPSAPAFAAPPAPAPPASPAQALAPPPAFAAPVEAPGSQVSSVNVASPLAPRSRAPLVIAALAPVVVATVIGVALLAARRHRVSEAAAAKAAESAVVEAPAAPAATGATAAEPAEAPSAVASAAPSAAPSDEEPAPSASAVASAAPSASAVASVAPAVKAAPPVAAPKPPKRSGCNPPYRIDARGVRVPKMECL